MRIEIFMKLDELTLEAQLADDLEHPGASASIDFAKAGTHFTIWGSPEEWENFSQWAHECAEARRKARDLVEEYSF